MKKLIYLLLFAVGCLATSCEKESENDYDSMIIGTWGHYKEYSDGEWWIYEEDDDLTVVEFAQNGSGTYYEYCPHDDETWAEPIKWKISGNKLKITLLDDEETISGEIVTLTDEELAIEYRDEYDYVAVSYFVKID